MTIVIEIGPVPSKESPALGDIATAVLAGVFVRQLNRRLPLPVGARYVAMQRVKSKPWLSVVLACSDTTWDSADMSMEKASAAREIDYWDDEALLELQERGLAPRTPFAALAA